MKYTTQRLSTNEENVSDRQVVYAVFADDKLIAIKQDAIEAMDFVAECVERDASQSTDSQ